MSGSGFGADDPAEPGKPPAAGEPSGAGDTAMAVTVIDADVTGGGPNLGHGVEVGNAATARPAGPVLAGVSLTGGDSAPTPGAQPMAANSTVTEAIRLTQRVTADYLSSSARLVQLISPTGLAMRTAREHVSVTETA